MLSLLQVKGPMETRSSPCQLARVQVDGRVLKMGGRRQQLGGDKAKVEGARLRHVVLALKAAGCCRWVLVA